MDAIDLFRKGTCIKKVQIPPGPTHNQQNNNSDDTVVNKFDIYNSKTFTVRYMTMSSNATVLVISQQYTSPVAQV